MNKVNAIIIEDEIKQLTLLKDLLGKHAPEVKIVATATSVLSGISVIKQHQPDIIFMDIMIQGGTSFDILDDLIDLDAELIFTTSYEKYAVQAFNMSAVHYLLKPIDSSELIEAVTRANKKLVSNNEAQLIKQLISNFRGQNIEDMKLALPTAKGYVFIKADQISRCVSDNTYTTFFLTDKREIIVSKTLKKCEQMLEEFSFCRVHNSCLINLKYIAEYDRSDGGIITMTDGAEVQISRRRKDVFLQLFKQQKP